MDFASPQSQCLVETRCAGLCVYRLYTKVRYVKCFYFKLLIFARQPAAFSAWCLSYLILIPFVSMSITIFEMEIKFYVRIFANEDWQTFFSENKFSFLLLIKIPWSPFSEKIIILFCY